MKFRVLAVITLVALPLLSFSRAGKESPERSTLDNALSDLTSQIVNSMVEEGKKKVAVIEFSDLDGRVTQFGKYLAEELITRLFISKRFEVIERQLLNKVVSEQKLSLTGLVDPGSAQELGRILGVDAIVSGTVTDLGPSLKVNARIISAASGTIFAVAATEITKDETVQKLIIAYTPENRSESAGKSSASGDSRGGIIVLSERENNNFNWSQYGIGDGSSPYLTTKEKFEGEVAFIPTGNNAFLKNLGTVGFEPSDFQYISLKIYLRKQEASLVLQLHINGSWEHRWGFDGRPNYQGYNWPRRGQMLNIPTNQWVDVKLDLIDDLGGKSGDKIQGLSLAGNDGNIIYDDVRLLHPEN